MLSKIFANSFLFLAVPVLTNPVLKTEQELDPVEVKAIDTCYGTGSKEANWNKHVLSRCERAMTFCCACGDPVVTMEGLNWPTGVGERFISVVFTREDGVYESVGVVDQERDKKFDDTIVKPFLETPKFGAS
ncbi:unnamed protein product [Cylicocyclus nassatus]|uniref:Uncharacterized protein n=1 Tax=Cylicocyclus nassatus TaxID=53992 RepID=A0AA36DMJ6_CYLNA|nr:unnamed protein product [Cylicocyclus nassatus]